MAYVKANGSDSGTPAIEQDNNVQDSVKKKSSKNTEDKMDVTALMDLLDKNHDTKPTKKYTKLDISSLDTSQLVDVKALESDISQAKANVKPTNLFEKDTNNGESISPEIEINTKNSNFLTFLLIIVAISAFIGMLYLIDNNSKIWVNKGEVSPIKVENDTSIRPIKKPVKIFKEKIDVPPNPTPNEIEMDLLKIISKE